MSRNASLGRFVGRETLLALLVLALAFLNFGHVSVSQGGGFRVVPDAWCGNPLLPDSPDHSPCHACRIGSGADLPPVPGEIAPVVFAVSGVTYATPTLGRVAAPLHLFANPRAPPAV